MFDGLHHIAKGGTVALVHDKNQPLCVDQRNVVGVQLVLCIILDFLYNFVL
jgi:hypothetical protein